MKGSSSVPSLASTIAIGSDVIGTVYYGSYHGLMRLCDHIFNRQIF